MILKICISKIKSKMIFLLIWKRSTCPMMIYNNVFVPSNDLKYLCSPKINLRYKYISPNSISNYSFSNTIAVDKSQLVFRLEEGAIYRQCHFNVN